MGRHSLLHRGEVVQGVGEIDRGEGIVTTEGEKIPVVISHSQARQQFFFAAGKFQPAAAVMANPGHMHMLGFPHPKFIQGKRNRLPHPREVVAQEGNVVRPEKGFAAGPQKQAVGDWMARIDRGDHRLQADTRASGYWHCDAIAGDNSSIAGLPVERDVGIDEAAIGRRRGERDSLGRLPSLSFQLPLHAGRGAGWQVGRSPLQTHKRGHDRSTVQRRRRDRHAVGRRLEQQPAAGIDPLRGRPLDLPPCR